MTNSFAAAVAGLTLGIAAATSSPAAAQTPVQAPVVTDLLAALDEVEAKLVGLAEAIPAERYDWRPGEGVRSVGEVFQHVAADNYYLTIPVGVAAPAATGIQTDYKTVQAYETRSADRDEIIAELKLSFEHIERAIAGTSGGRLAETVNVFGTDMTVRRLWFLAVTHVHEHLGQMIAYARSNAIVPPWNR